MHPPTPTQTIQDRSAALSDSSNVERPRSAGAMLASAKDETNPISDQGLAILASFIAEFVGDFDEQKKVRAREVFEDVKRVIIDGASEPVFTSDFDQGVFPVMVNFARDIAEKYPHPAYSRRYVETGGEQHKA